MENPNQAFGVYKRAIEQVMEGEERLPSLPAITLKIRTALNDPQITHNQLANLVIKDPALSALLMKASHSAAYRTQSQAKNLSDAIRLLGHDAVHSLAMLHSVKSLFVMKSPALKKLFLLSWERQSLKTAICVLLTQASRFQPAFMPVTGSFLSELGTFAILSAFNSLERPPELSDYITLCRHYSKNLSAILLKKWQLEESYIDLTRNTGNWLLPKSAALSALEIVNLSLHQAIKWQAPQAELPPLASLPCFQNLPVDCQRTDKHGQLSLVNERKLAIENYVALVR